MTRIETVDTIRAYTFGVKYLEVDVQLSPDMPPWCGNSAAEARLVG